MCNRKSFSVWIENRFVPISASVVQHQDQVFISLQEDSAPTLSIQNLTDFQFHVAQAVEKSKVSQAVNECGGDLRFAWHQISPARHLIYYTPPLIDETFPEIQSLDVSIVFSCVGSQVRWSRPLKINENKDVLLEVPLYGDIKVSIDAEGKTTKIVLDYIRQDSEFSAKDIRNRLSYPISVSSAEIIDSSSLHEAVEISSVDTVDTLKSPVPVVHALIEGLRISLYTDCHKTTFERNEMLLLDFQQLSIRMVDSAQQMSVAFSSFQADNSLFSTGEFDFPVIVCPQLELKQLQFEESVHELEYWWSKVAQKSLEERSFCSIDVSRYVEGAGCKSIEVKLRPVRAFIEDTYISVLVDYLNECFGSSALFDSEPEMERVKCVSGEVLIPRIVQQQAILLADPVRIKRIYISGFHALISVHTCLR